MKRIFLFILTTSLFASLNSSAQDDKSKRPSPPATATQTISSGAKITIDYSQPSLKDRVIGKDLAEYGKVWRTGANEATTFEVSKDVTVGGKSLKAGKYALLSIPGENEWTIIFNKTWKQWGSYEYKEADDALRIKVKSAKVPAATEKMTFKIGKEGSVSLLWGTTQVSFKVK